MTKKPDAVMIGGSGTPGALPDVALHRRGYKGLIYGNHGMVGPAFLRVGGASVEGTIAVTGPVVVYDQLPDSVASRGPATTFMKALIAKFGPTRAARSPATARTRSCCCKRLSRRR